MKRHFPKPPKYFIDGVNGDDNNSGRSYDDAWKTSKNIPKKTLAAGDKIAVRGSERLIEDCVFYDNATNMT